MRSVGYGMADWEDGALVQKIGEFCCTSKYVRFLIFHLRTHTEKVEVKIKDLSDNDPSHTQLYRYLGIVKRTLIAVEKEVGRKEYRQRSFQRRGMQKMVWLLCR